MEVKRFLSEAEIKDILSFIKPFRGIPEEIAQSVVERHFNNYARQVRSFPIYPCKIGKLKEILERQYHRAQVEPGKCVGAVASSSIGEKQTQNTLSSFHSAGQFKIELTTGLPRLEELMSVTKEIRTPSMNIFLTLPEEQLKDLSVVRRFALQMFSYREVMDLLLYYDHKENRVLTESEKLWYDYYHRFHRSEDETCSWSIRLNFDTRALFTSENDVLLCVAVCSS